MVPPFIDARFDAILNVFMALHPSAEVNAEVNADIIVIVDKLQFEGRDRRDAIYLLKLVDEYDIFTTKLSRVKALYDSFIKAEERGEGLPKFRELWDDFDRLVVLRPRSNQSNSPLQSCNMASLNIDAVFDVMLRAYIDLCRSEEVNFEEVNAGIIVIIDKLQFEGRDRRDAIYLLRLVDEYETIKRKLSSVEALYDSFIEAEECGEGLTKFQKLWDAFVKQHQRQATAAGVSTA